MLQHHDFTRLLVEERHRQLRRTVEGSRAARRFRRHDHGRTPSR